MGTYLELQGYLINVRPALVCEKQDRWCGAEVPRTLAENDCGCRTPTIRRIQSDEQCVPSLRT